VEETATESRGIVEESDQALDTADIGDDRKAAQFNRPPRDIQGAGAHEGRLVRAEPRDAPYCYQCGNAMQRAGSCYVCGSCGTTSGCS
jgi:hypothetical protein